MSDMCTENVPVLLRRATFCSAFAADARDFRAYNSWVCLRCRTTYASACSTKHVLSLAIMWVKACSKLLLECLMQVLSLLLQQARLNLHTYPSVPFRLDNWTTKGYQCVLDKTPDRILDIQACHLFGIGDLRSARYACICGRRALKSPG